MKHKSWMQNLIGALFAFFFSVSTVGILTTGWDLAVSSAVRLLLWCGLFSSLSAVLFYFRYGWCGILLLSIRGAFALWQDGALWEQMQTFVYKVSSHFHNVYSWPVIGSHSTGNFSLLMILAAWLTALSVSFCICCRKHSIIALPAILLPLVLCLITTDTLPDTPYLFLVILGLVLLLVTDWGRRKNPRQFASHTLRTTIPAAAALALLFVLCPQEIYVNPTEKLQNTVWNWFQQIQSTAENAVSENITGSFAFQKLNLKNVGPKSDFTYNVMRVTASYDGTAYLRGRDYDVYTGTAWESSGRREELFTRGDDASGSLTIHTSGVGNVMYIPYYAVNEVVLRDGMAENSGNAGEYSFSTAKNPVGLTTDVSPYYDLPYETYVWAGELAARITREEPDERSRIQRIADYVRNSAVYDRSTSAMSADADDFAKWFLTESDTGYCVHFATAAAVLLRAAGIPARYVEGYMVSCQADEQVTVTNQEAHAWVEYYDSHAAVWRILEATPAAGSLPDGESAEENESAQTEPETETADGSSTDEQTQEQQNETEASEPMDLPGNTDAGNENAGTDGNVGTGAGSSGGIGSDSAENGGGTAQREPFVMPEWVDEAVWILLALLMIPVQGSIRIRIKQRYWNRGTPNEMAIRRWRQSVRLAELTGMEMPDVLETLALKAKFSQHTLSDRELETFTLFRQQVLQTVDGMPWYRKVFLRWILAVG